MEIRPATPAEEREFFAHNDPCIRDLMAGLIDGAVVAMAGVMRDPRYHGSIFEEDGRWIGFLQLAPGAAPLGPKPVRAMQRYLKTQAEAIIVLCDETQPKAERLLKILGFTPTDHYEADFRLPTRKLRSWTWQPLVR